MELIATALASGIIALVLAVLFQDALKSLLIVILGRLYRPWKRGIDGRWIATFSMTRQGIPTNYVEVIEITQRIGMVKGHIVQDERNYNELGKAKPDRPLRLRGEITESFYTYRYVVSPSPNPSIHGFFPASH